MPEIIAYTDGACSGNPGPGGWGVLLQAKAGQKIVKEKELYGGLSLTTNNQMELTAAIAALEVLNKKSTITIVTDSIYVKNGITVWLKKWENNGWRTANNKKIKNIELWKKLHELAKNHTVNWLWVKGHTGNPGNEKADSLARRGIDSLKK